MNNQKNVDVVVVSVPWIDSTSPIMAPAFLKSIILKTGLSCCAFDLNAEIVSKLKDNPLRDDIIRFFNLQQSTVEISSILYDLFEYMVDRIMQYQPKYVCLSLLTYDSQIVNKWLTYAIKQRYPDTIIIVGGTGLSNHLGTEGDPYAPSLKNMGLIDHFVRGDGENALYDLLSTNNDDKMDTDDWEEINDLSKLPFPDYDDYNFELYELKFLAIIGSRGCVRRCTFCDIHEHWKKFSFRTGGDIFDEMVFQNRKYGIRHFKFYDSLTNGNQKEYNVLIRLLAEYNKNNLSNSFSWTSYFIFRPKSAMSEEMWKLTAEAGATELHVGVESLVDKNRHHMKKHFDNADIEYSLQMAKKYKLVFWFLIIVGYVTETEEDHQEAINWVSTHSEYTDVIKFSFGGTLGLTPNTFLTRNEEELGIVWTDTNRLQTSGDNIRWEVPKFGNTYKVRLRRLGEIYDVAIKYKFTAVRMLDPHKELARL